MVRGYHLEDSVDTDFATVLNVHFHYRAVKDGKFNYKLKVIMYTLYASNLLLLLRNCFRAAAFFFPWDSAANSQEWAVWVFEYIPMVINTYLMNIYPPAKYLPANHKIYLAMDGVTEVEGPGMIDKRPFLATLFDPFDISGIIKGKDRKNRYWLRDGIGGPLPEEPPDANAAPEINDGNSNTKSKAPKGVIVLDQGVKQVKTGV